MKKALNIIAVVAAVAVAAPAYSQITCAEMRDIAYSFAVARNQGTSLSRARQLVDEDTNFSRSEKQSLKKLADQIYSDSLSPSVTIQLADAVCRSAGMQ